MLFQEGWLAVDFPRTLRFKKVKSLKTNLGILDWKRQPKLGTFTSGG